MHYWTQISRVNNVLGVRGWTHLKQTLFYYPEERAEMICEI